MTIINSVIKGVTPTGTTQITTNGTHNVSAYEYADVQVPSPTYYVEKTKDANNVLQNGSTVIDLTGVTGIDNYALAYAYYGVAFPANTSLDLSSITTVGTYGFYSAFDYTSNITSVDLSGLTTVSGDHGCAYMFDRCYALTSINLSSLKTISGPYGCQNMFNRCTGITSVDLSLLETISNVNSCDAMFNTCTALTSVDLSSLETISGSCGSMFNGCTALTSIDLSNLKTISSSNACSQLFNNCTSLVNVDLSSLETVSGNGCCGSMFKNCTNLTKLSFYALTPSSFGTRTNQFNSMLSGVTGCTVHFPIRIQSTIGSWSDVTAGFGGTNTTVLFDIVCTLTGADSNTYTRQQKDSTSTATAWIYNDTLYYTSGTAEPVVNDTIYSDAACTTAVTTISSIA